MNERKNKPATSYPITKIKCVVCLVLKSYAQLNSNFFNYRYTNRLKEVARAVFNKYMFCFFFAR